MAFALQIQTRDSQLYTRSLLAFRQSTKQQSSVMTDVLHTHTCVHKIPSSTLTHPLIYSPPLYRISVLQPHHTSHTSHGHVLSSRLRRHLHSYTRPPSYPIRSDPIYPSPHKSKPVHSPTPIRPPTQTPMKVEISEKRRKTPWSSYHCAAAAAGAGVVSTQASIQTKNTYENRRREKRFLDCISPIQRACVKPSNLIVSLSRSRRCEHGGTVARTRCDAMETGSKSCCKR